MPENPETTALAAENAALRAQLLERDPRIAGLTAAAARLSE